jgi:hypothetical protein
MARLHNPVRLKLRNRAVVERYRSVHEVRLAKAMAIDGTDRAVDHACVHSDEQCDGADGRVRDIWRFLEQCS